MKEKLVNFNLQPGQQVFIGRHGHCDPATTDAERKLSNKGYQETSMVSDRLRQHGFGFLSIQEKIFINYISAIVSPAPRVRETLNVFFPEMNVVRLEYEDLYNFEQFKALNDLYHAGNTNPRDYLNASPNEVIAFQNKFFEATHNLIAQSQYTIILSHAIISNFVAMIFVDNTEVYDLMLPESAGFLITQQSEDQQTFTVIKPA